MNMRELFRSRRTTYFKDLLKYSRYILNDHFVLLLLLIIGGGGFTYRNYLETVHPGMLLPKILLILVFSFLLISGKITLLVKSADQLYLLPKTHDFRPIFNQQVLFSFGKSILPIGLFMWIGSPLLLRLFGISLFGVFTIFLAFLSLKWFNILVRIFPFFNTGEEKFKKYRLLMIVFTLISVSILLFVHIPLVAAVLGILFLGTMSLFLSGKLYAEQTLKWEKMIEVEEKRMQGMYRFIQLFTDVPFLPVRIQRFKWLDPMIEFLTKNEENVIGYYLVRVLLRNENYRGLIMRLTIIGSFLLAFTENIGLAIVFVFLFIYMTGFQLLALNYEMDQILPFHIYPLKEGQKQEALLEWILKILMGMTGIYSVSSSFQIGLKSLGLFLIGSIFTYFLTKIYLSKRITTGKE